MAADQYEFSKKRDAFMRKPKIRTEKELRDATDAEMRAAEAYGKLNLRKPDFGRTSDLLDMETYSRLGKNDPRIAKDLEAAGKAIEEADAERLRESRRGKKPGIMDTIKSTIGMKKGGKVSSASKRADGIAQRGKTRGRMI